LIRCFIGDISIIDDKGSGKLAGLFDMVLTITALRYKGRPLDSPLNAVFRQEGGKLGRASGNHLVLDDEEKVVSGEHAIIAYDNGEYYYIDTSLNGTRITNRNKRIHQDKILLKDQDELQIGDYDLVLRISSNASEAPLQQAATSDALSMALFDQDDAETYEQPAAADHATDEPSMSCENHTPDAYSGVGFGMDANFNSMVDESFTPPELGEPSMQPQALPEDFSLEDFFGNEASSLVMLDGLANGHVQGLTDEVGANVDPLLQEQDLCSESQKVPPSAPTADLPDIFFRAAGIEDVDGYPDDRLPELMTLIGTVFRELVAGLMTVLRSRSELKSHFRVTMTTLKPAENNPLKFSPTVEEALSTILTNSNPGFADAVGAVREGYEDIRNHQLAITAGVQASLVSILKRFDPKHLAEKFEGSLVLQKKAKCWDEYKQAYQQFVDEALENFFGDEFVRAYEEQIDKLRTHQKLS
jgi:type VI secretion system protein ImpI/type VI secretion system protein